MHWLIKAVYTPARELGFALHDVARLLRTYSDQRARELNTTRAQWAVLVAAAALRGRQAERTRRCARPRADHARPPDRQADLGRSGRAARRSGRPPRPPALSHGQGGAGAEAPSARSPRTSWAGRWPGLDEDAIRAMRRRARDDQGQSQERTASRSLRQVTPSQVRRSRASRCTTARAPSAGGARKPVQFAPREARRSAPSRAAAPRPAAPSPPRPRRPPMVVKREATGADALRPAGRRSADRARARLRLVAERRPLRHDRQFLCRRRRRC